MASSTNEAALAEYYTTHTIPWTIDPGIVVASIVVSFLGSYATLMLLGRRTAEKGVRNLIWLLLAALTFGVVGLWSMHFVSMLGLRLLPSSTQPIRWYIRFSSGFTALSLFIPLICISLAFLSLGSQSTSIVVWRIVLTGCCVGLTITFMHYSSLFRLASFNVHYRGWVIVLAALEACLAATIALLAFFKYRALWQDNILKRIGCAAILAAAVCGLHYIGLAGTSWTYKPGTSLQVLSGAKRHSTRLTIAISVMCLVIICTSIGIAIADLVRRRKTVREARQIVVCSAAFDKFGRVLVKLDGTLSMMLIETEAYVKDIVDELDPKQPTFQWLFKLSFNWRIITSFHSLIAESIAARRAGKETGRAAPEPKGVYGRNGSRAAAARAHAKKTAELRLFRQRFVEAAYELSSQIDVPMEDLGTLFDRVLPTGTLGASHAAALSEKDTEAGAGAAVEDVEIGAAGGEEGGEEGAKLKEAGNQEGVMLVVVRELTDQRQLDQFLLNGYRLAETKHFSHVFASRVGVPKQDMDDFLLGCKTFAKRGTRPVVQASGAYVGLFGVTPTDVGPQRNLNVLTYGFSRHQIPAYRLPDLIAPLTSENRNFLRSIAGLTLTEVLERIDHDIAKPQQNHHSHNSHHSHSRRSNNNNPYSSHSRPSSQQSHSSNNRWSSDSADDDYDDQDDSADPLLDFQIALSIAIEALSNSMVGPWPNIADIARLSPEILSVPSSDDNSADPAQVIVFSAFLPSLAPPPSAGRVRPASSLGEKRMSTHDEEVEMEKSRLPPPPFVFTPLSLFSAAQTMLIRGRGAEDFAKEVVQQLAYDYGSYPVPQNPPRTSTGSKLFPPSLSPTSTTKELSFDLSSSTHPSRLSYTPTAPHAHLIPSAQSISSARKDPSSFDQPRIAGAGSASELGFDPLDIASLSPPPIAQKSHWLQPFKPQEKPLAMMTKKPTIPQRSASLGEGRRGSGSDVEDGSIIGGRHPLPTIGRFAVGGSDGFEKRLMKDLELSADGKLLAGVDW